MQIEPLSLTMVERLHADNLYLCVRVEGEDAEGSPRYAYFGIFLKDFQELLQRLQRTPSMNPKDAKGIVLARSKGVPSPEIRGFMRLKFSFADELENEVPVLEISRKK